MKKLISLSLALMLALGMVSFALAAEGTFDLALVTDIGTIDDKSFNQGAWEGVVKYAEEFGVSHKYYQPTEQADDAYLAAIQLAVENGAKLIVTPGFLFEVPIFIAQDMYPDVNFVLVDGNPQAAMQAFMAGKIRVEGDMTKLMALQAAPPDEAHLDLAERLRAITE